jgi:hypothetical protein
LVDNSTGSVILVGPEAIGPMTTPEPIEPRAPGAPPSRPAAGPTTGERSAARAARRSA